MTAELPEAWQKLSDEFHMTMGYCIAAWAQVDNELFRIFADCMALTDHSAIIYYRTPGLDVRFGMADEIVKTTLLPSWERPGHGDPRIKAWKAATKGVRDLLSVRRRIAHQPVTPRQEPFRCGMPLGERAPSWYEIHVSRHERLRDNAAKLPPLTITDLRKHRAEVAMLTDRLAAFFHDVLTKPETAFSPPIRPPRWVPGSGTDRPAKRLRRRQSSPP
jgi:hypothetical protein